MSKRLPTTKSAAPNHHTRWIAYTWLLISVLCWGAALPIVKPALDVTSPFRYLLYRYLIAIVFSLPILLYFLPKIKNLKKTLLIILGAELIGTTLSLGMLYVGLKHTTAIQAGLITSASPIFTTLLGMWFLREKEEHHEWLGLFIAFASTVILALSPWFRGQNGLNHFSVLGNTLIIAQNLTSAIYWVLAKKYYHDLPKFFVTSISFYIGATTFFILSLFEQNFSLPSLLHNAQLDLQSPVVWFASGYMAIFGSLIGLTAIIKGQDKIEISEASLFGYLQPLVYIPLSIFLLKETFEPFQLLMLIGIFLGVFIAEKRFRFRSR